MKKFAGLFVVTILAASFVFAQQAKPTPAPTVDPVAKAAALARDNVFEKQLDSKLMSRKMPYRIILPANYLNQNDTARYPVVFLLHGLTGHYDNWTEKTKVAEYAKKAGFIIVTPEGDNGWYTDSVSTANDKYESYIVKELVPEIDKNYRTLADREH